MINNKNNKCNKRAQTFMDNFMLALKWIVIFALVLLAVSVFYKRLTG